MNKKKLIHYPNLVKQWDWKKNHKTDIYKITYGTSKKYWWICTKNKKHNWEATVSSRTIRKRNCPYCAGKKVDDSNNLKSLFPKITQEWNYKKNKNLSPNEVSSGSHKKVWWICKKGHEWEAMIGSRTGPKKTGCPYCSNKKVNKDNNLLNNFSKIAKEWHPTKNGKITPAKIVYGSNQKVWWLCENGHEWKSMVVNRTGPKKTGCPKCSKRISSFEIRILSELENFFHNIKPIYKFKDLEIDLYLEDFKIGIEYDGWYFHKNRNQQDKEKNKLLKKYKIYLIRIREKPLKKISTHDILIKQNNLTKQNLNTLLKKIISVSKINNKNISEYLLKENFQFEKNYQKYLSFYPAPIPQKSLKQTHRALSKEWDYKKNYPLKPENFYSNSGTSVWWKCNLNHSWKRRIANRTLKNNPTGCPFCAGKKVSITNSLKSLYPKISKEFNKTKNGILSPENLIAGSHLKIWWKCKKGHEWKAQIRARTRQNACCPYCKGGLATKENNLKKLHPNLAKEWHPTKNKKIIPSEVRPHSNKKFWWVCKYKHIWQTSPSDRVSGRGCPYCANKRVSKTNNLKVVSPELSKEWHPRKNHPLKPKDIIAKSGKIYWWKCKKGHEWQSSPANRHRRGCPYCGKHFVTKEKSLKFLFPNLATEWHPTKNKGITPEEIHAHSNKKIWWKCKKGHEFVAPPSRRLQRNKFTQCNKCRLGK